MINPAVSLQDIAREARVSAMTVSRIIRQLPGASAKTRQKVLTIADRLGYLPDPDLARAMNVVRTKKSRRRQSVIAVVREAVPEDELQLGGGYHFMPHAYIQRSAAAHGYLADEFFLGKDGLTAKRLSGILYARGVEGIIVYPQSVAMPCRDLDYSRFASVVLSYSMKEPSLHRSATNVFPGIQSVLAELKHRGYERIGIAVSRWADDRTQNVYSSGMLHYQHGQAGGHVVPLLLFPHNDFSQDEALFRRWLKKHRPDVIISFDTHVPGWIHNMGLRIPEDIGLVVHDWMPGMTAWAGIDHRREYIADGAVDLLVMQLMRGERGIPLVPRELCIPPAWVEGPSIRPRANP